jgi:hypothetical protein
MLGMQSNGPFIFLTRPGLELRNSSPAQVPS